MKDLEDFVPDDVITVWSGKAPDHKAEKCATPLPQTMGAESQW